MECFESTDSLDHPRRQGLWHLFCTAGASHRRRLWRCPRVIQERRNRLGAVLAEDERQAISRARRIEAAYFEPTRGIADSEALRLSALHGELARFLAAKPGLARFSDIQLVPGEPPRLWIDLVTSVVMEPDYRTYRIQQEFADRRSILLETSRQDEALRFLKTYFVERRALPGARAAPNGGESAPAGGSASSAYGTVMFAWLSGLVLGLLIVLLAVNSLK